MPLERVSKSFKDVSMSFKVNPFNSDVLTIKNETAIARSVRNLILTTKGERFFNPELGCGVNKLLFDNVDDLTADRIKSEIEYTVETYEPRVKLTNIQVVANIDGHTFDVVIRYNIIGIDASPQQLSFVLQSSR
ncbi:T4-like baseplate wedge [uncultured phage MedDCM-OCT-S04-C93]|nr:T4-like baseplate wedge [uncultured phage MedDCM-OCT-S04-C93]BAR36589.1 base plate wedge subunit [uncultured Mediterranean phage uvMED]|tara:strand:+ start:2239 stop:2640 length:402 start_codon:yes stop_codon:yes gene_type:complete